MRRALFVHEDKGIRDYISHITTHKSKLEGVSASIVESPEKAYKRLKEFSYDVIISDTRFNNDLNEGINFYNRLKNDKENKNIPFGFIACTHPDDLPAPSITSGKPKELRKFIDDLVE